MINIEELRFSKDHLWAKIDGETDRVIIGLTDYAQQKLGDIVAIDLPGEGDELVKDEAFGSIESSRMVMDLFAPVSGEIVAVNGEVLDNPEIINDDPYEEGWLLVADADQKEFDKLLTWDEYDDYLSEVEGRPLDEDEEI